MEMDCAFKEYDEARPDLTQVLQSCPFSAADRVHGEEDILRCKVNTPPSVVLYWKSGEGTYSSSCEESHKTFSKSRRKVAEYTNKTI